MDKEEGGEIKRTGCGQRDRGIDYRMHQIRMQRRIEQSSKGNEENKREMRRGGGREREREENIF